MVCRALVVVVLASPLTLAFASSGQGGEPCAKGGSNGECSASVELLQTGIEIKNLVVNEKKSQNQIFDAVAPGIADATIDAVRATFLSSVDAVKAADREAGRAKAASECTDKHTCWMLANGLNCSSWPWLVNRCNNANNNLLDYWANNSYCQSTCFALDVGYVGDDCSNGASASCADVSGDYVIDYFGDDSPTLPATQTGCSGLLNGVGFSVSGSVVTMDTGATGNISAVWDESGCSRTITWSGSFGNFSEKHDA